jgi:hypothetical protein
MTSLGTLKLVAAKKATHIAPVQQRRNKLAKRLWEQAQLARALATGTNFAPVKHKTVWDKASGERKQVETRKRIKQWWFVADNGKLALSVHYGTKTLELAKGKWAVEVASDADVAPTLDAIKQAVLAGELDVQIEAAANKLRAGFGK